MMCRKGLHEMTPENTVTTSNRPTCRECRKASRQEYEKRNRFNPNRLARRGGPRDYVAEGQMRRAASRSGSL